MRSNGTLVTDEMLARVAAKAEAGVDLNRLRQRTTSSADFGLERYWRAG